MAIQGVPVTSAQLKLFQLGPLEFWESPIIVTGTRIGIYMFERKSRFFYITILGSRMKIILNPKSI